MFDDPRNETGHETDHDVCRPIRVVCLLTIDHVTTLCLDLGSDRFFGRESASGREPETGPEWRMRLGLGAGHCDVHTFGQMTDADRMFQRTDLS